VPRRITASRATVVIDVLLAFSLRSCRAVPEVAAAGSDARTLRQQKHTATVRHGGLLPEARRRPVRHGTSRHQHMHLSDPETVVYWTMTACSTW